MLRKVDKICYNNNDLEMSTDTVQGSWLGLSSLPLTESEHSMQQQRDLKHYRQNQQLNEGIYCGRGNTFRDTQKKTLFKAEGGLGKPKAPVSP